MMLPIQQSMSPLQMNNSTKNQINQNPNLILQNTVQQTNNSIQSSIENYRIKKSDIRESRNKSPLMVIKEKESKIVSTQPDSYGENIKQNSFTNNGFLDWASITKIGSPHFKKTNNQDTPLVYLSVGKIKGFNLFGVLDGHGPHGHFVSRFCKDYFIRKAEEFAYQCKKEYLSNPKDIYEKLKKSNFSFIRECFIRVDKEMMKQNQFEYNYSGTTCNLVFQFMKYIVCASVGDSKGIIIFDDGTKTNPGIFPLTHDHKPNLPQ